MSIEPAVFDLVFRQGSTFDETWGMYDDEDQTQPTDLAGWSGAMKVRKDVGTGDPPILALATGGAAPPGGDGIFLSSGAIRVYIRDETLAALAHSLFEDLSAGASPAGPFAGVWDLELENPAGERFRWAEGRLRFSREVTR